MMDGIAHVHALLEHHEAALVVVVPEEHVEGEPVNCIVAGKPEYGLRAAEMLRRVADEVEKKHAAGLN